MEKRFYWLYLLAILVFIPFLLISSQHVWGADKNEAVRVKAGYDMYMQQGYAATSKREYKIALGYFQQALKERPGDKYAIAAVRNIEGYNKRNVSIRNARLVFVPVGKPGNRTSAASRAGNCSQNGQLPVPLIPDTDSQLTSNPYPTLFFYIPKNTARAFKLTVKDKTNGKPFKTIYPVTNNSGIIRVNFADIPNQPPLEINKQYNWTFSLVCDTQAVDKDMDVKDVIQRIEPDANLRDLLKTAKLEQLPALYATAGFWFDALTSLADLRRQYPQDKLLVSDWESLLESVVLRKDLLKSDLYSKWVTGEEVIQAPLLDCCQVKKSI